MLFCCLSHTRSKKEQLSIQCQIELYKERLCEVAQTDIDKIAVAKEATMRGWETFYPVRKTRGTKAQNKQPEAKKAKFCNFEQRKYNMSELESMLLKSN